MTDLTIDDITDISGSSSSIGDPYDFKLVRRRPSLTPWQRENLENEYRAVCQQITALQQRKGWIKMQLEKDD